MENTSEGNSRQWWENYQHDREILTGQVNQLTRDVSALAAEVKNLVQTQKTILDKGNRPFQWGAFVSAIIGAGVFAGLLIRPIDAELALHHDFDDRVVEHMIEDSHEMGRVKAELEWLAKGEERSYTHHETEWNRVKEAMDADLENDMDRIHTCGETTKNMLFEHLTEEAK
jgi:predicted transcriptional regulator